MCHEGRAPRLVEPEEMVPPLLYVVSLEADTVNGWRFAANLSGTGRDRPQRPRAAPAARPVSKCTDNRLDDDHGGHSSEKPARRRPTFTVFSRSAQYGGLAIQGAYARHAASELTSGLSMLASAISALASSISPRRPSAPARIRTVPKAGGFAARAFLRSSIV